MMGALVFAKRIIKKIISIKEIAILTVKKSLRVVDKAQRAEIDPIPLTAYTKESMALANAMDFSWTDISRVQQHPERISSGPYSVNWYLPPFDNAFYGGVMTILRIADYLLREERMHQRFLICGEVNKDLIFDNIVKAFSGLKSCEVIVLNTTESTDNISPSDFSIATLWTTAYTLLKVKNTGLKFYLIQDFEPLFYPAGSTYAQAEATYKFGFYGIANTISLRNIYQNEYKGVATHFTPCVDTQVFYPPSDRRKDSPKRIFFYGRPGHPRNSFELAITALRKLKESYGADIQILSAGSNWQPKDYGLEGIIENLGLLTYEETGDLYRSCHVGLSMMMTKHPSYLPFEMMACGVLVVSNINESTKWLLKDRENCLLSYPSVQCITTTIAEAIDRYDTLENVRINAGDTIKRDHSNWSAEMRKVRDFILENSEKKTKCRGSLMQSNGDIFGSRVFYVENQFRHYVPDLDWINENGYSYPGDIQVVDDEVLLSLSPARSAPHFWSFQDWQNPPRNSSMQMREISASRLYGQGIEVGASSSPFPIPLHCHVEYADLYSKGLIADRIYPGQNLNDLVDVTLVTGLEELDGVDDESLDFIVACHVIEHVRNPLLALERSYKKLSLGGSLVLVVPDKERTFDKDRELTTLDHLIEDYKCPSVERDKQHYLEFFQLAFPTPPEKLHDVVEMKFQRKEDIHYHTFTYDSFMLLIDFASREISPWSSVWSQPTLSNLSEDIEFYFVLTK